MEQQKCDAAALISFEMNHSLPGCWEMLYWSPPVKFWRFGFWSADAGFTRIERQFAQIESQRRKMESRGTRVGVKVGGMFRDSVFHVSLNHLLTWAHHLLSWRECRWLPASHSHSCYVQEDLAWLRYRGEIWLHIIIMLGWTLTFALCLMQTLWFFFLSLLKPCSLNTRGSCSVSGCDETQCLLQRRVTDWE